MPSLRPNEKLYNNFMLAIGGGAVFLGAMANDPGLMTLGAATVALPLNGFREEGAALRQLPPPRGFRIQSF